MLDKVVFGLAGIGLTAIVAGTTFVIQFEGRISKLEAQSNFALGVTSSGDMQTKSPGAGTKSSGMQVADQAGSNELQKALAASCAKLADTYNEIIAAGSIYTSETQRLTALSSQMEKLNCTSP